MRGRPSHARNLTSAIAFCVITAIPLKAQTNKSTFEVATIRHAKDNDATLGSYSHPGIGSFSATHVSLAFLVHIAYGVDQTQITGAPEWFGTDLFDVTAKPESGIKLSREELKSPLQQLLKDRFHLTLHQETALVSGLALVVAKSCPKLPLSKSDYFPNFRVEVSDGHLEGFHWSMPFLATQLLQPTGMPVEDRTHLTGSYDLKLLYAPEAEPDSQLPSLRQALRDTLGLSLEPAKVRVDKLVIDHADRTPAEN